MPHPADEPGPAAPATDLSVVVERSGGFAGLTRRWSVTAGPGETDRWVALIDACAWDQPSGPSPEAPEGADRFCWTVSATTPSAAHRAALGESQIDGPWRDLIDAVREAAAAPRPDAETDSAPEQ
jgi:hypothetical protein